MRMTQKPVTYLVFPTEQQRQQREGNIVQRRSNDRRQEITTHQPGYSQSEQRLESPERHKPEEHSDRCTEGNRMGGILQLEELPTLIAKPGNRVHVGEVTQHHLVMEQRIVARH